MPANMHPMIYRAIDQGEGHIDVTGYVALHRDVDLEGLVDLIEARDVHDSWAAAAARDMEAQRGGR